MSWHTDRMCGFDLETTGIDVETDRIVTATVVQCGGGQPTVPASWLADPGIEIPEGAAKVHGITTERARAEGKPAAEVVADVLAALGQVIASGVPIVAMNARYDLTLLDREAARYGLPPLPAGPIIDPLVLDKQVDRYRRGKRTLTALCEHYDVPLGAAHTSDADAIAACRVAWRIGATRPAVAALSLEELHTAQVGWAAEQAASLQAHLRKTTPDAYCAPEWPLIPRQQNGER
ncbi:3'-5' exonuclease [Streptomyces sp. SP18ES09]|uniref:3'-5' exonuclease n=1 Tax=Streptomyces sp. SP18ES09 TaxID=3002532 RepID=UPI002E783D97|nr:3'-5' exonuclease [Streptomyces sp. SP18ES09]MEE1814256.1 3'-5' exonuclease [Streptomyces sp. SP18ES09]